MVEKLTVFRGQKDWELGMEIVAPTLRRAIGVDDPVSWTATLLAQFRGLISACASGHPHATKQLEDQLLYSQYSVHLNPFVSCSRQWSVAQSFALHGNTDGYILTIEVDQADGVDYKALREQYGLFGDAVEHLEEYGIAGRVDESCLIRAVHSVRPYGAPSEQVFVCG